MSLIAMMVLFQCIRLEYELQTDRSPCGVDPHSDLCTEQHLFRSWETTVGDLDDAADSAQDKDMWHLLDEEEPMTAAVRWKTAVSLLDENTCGASGSCGTISYVAEDDGSVVRYVAPVQEPPPASEASTSLQPAQQQHDELQAKAAKAAVAASDVLQKDGIEQPVWLKDFTALQERLEKGVGWTNLSSGEATKTSPAAPSSKPHHNLTFTVGSQRNFTAEHLAHHAEHLKHKARHAAEMADLAAHQAEYKAKLHEIEESHVTWEKKFNAEIQSVERELCADPRRKDYPSCKQFLPENASATPSAPPALRGATMKAKQTWVTKPVWVAAKASAAGNHSREHSAVALPKVACVTVIPCQKSAMAYAKFYIANFIENFKNQSYEGPKQLILVYHTENKEARALVKLHADGALIKGVAAFGSELPSTNAYRFGAWSADSPDVVARWDFNAWHHPRRLETQIHALALAARPGCLLQRWTVLEGDGGRNHTESDGGITIWDSSLVGEAQWMHRNWHPLLKEERAVIEGGEAQHLVHIDNSPDLLVYNPDLVGTKAP
eukprot:gnl/TRDRNA2_/TRDRNA2_180113_c0_seq1.p1 gnl/TRDRNA2_/TRDRNA2_180113_c0~~gnl/TRDRNA2_/TRDRNA2_180113_c0_seq1.p1  ORF type:complete len:602 (-),score=126.44 gnl/TRDRNA2_/TRDRNA2_180113_c0_seq1:100-1749(-)